MANSTVVKSTIALKYVSGQDEQGRDIMKKQSFNNVKPTATPQELYNVGTSISGLLVSGYGDIYKSDESVVTNA